MSAYRDSSVGIGWRESKWARGRLATLPHCAITPLFPVQTEKIYIFYAGKNFLLKKQMTGCYLTLLSINTSYHMKYDNLNWIGQPVF
jgi:hypothetical protein